MTNIILETHKHLKNDVLWLALVWNRFHQLFSSGDERMELLRKTATGFFKMTQLMMVDTAIMVISRLSDKTQDGLNLTLFSLQELIQGDNPQLADLINEQLTKLEGMNESIRKHRNKRVAHRDAQTTLGEEPLPPILRKEIDEAVEQVFSIMNTVQEHYEQSETPYDATGMPGDIEDLLYYLEKSLASDNH